jgi:1,4-dihydroxy-2-naphthoate octaprenyltransferase
MLSWGSLLVAWPTWRIVRQEDGEILNLALAGTGKIALAYSLLFAMGMVLTRL